MAKKAKKSSSKSPASESNVVRIKASESAPKKNTKETKVAKTAKAEKAVEIIAAKPVKQAKAPKVAGEKRGRGVLTPVFAFGNYFKGAWYELRQVRWPNRRATWSLTGAVLAYSAFFVILVLLLDAAFKYMFELILGK